MEASTEALSDAFEHPELNGLIERIEAATGHDYLRHPNGSLALWEDVGDEDWHERARCGKCGALTPCLLCFDDDEPYITKYVEACEGEDA